MREKQTVIRNKIYGITFVIAFVCVMLFAVCDNTPNLSDENGYGRISISFEGGATSQTARTVLPSTAFDKYVYTFTKSGGAVVEKAPDKNGFFTLELGSYTVEVKAYIGTAEPFTLVASGVSSQFTVSPGSNAAVEVFLSEVNSGGQGKFSYTITYPAGATAEITLQKWPGLNNITINPGNIANGKTQTLQLDTGSYLLAVLVNKDGSSAGISEAVHITSSLSTVYTKNFNDNDLIAPIAVSAVTVKPSTSLVVGGTEMLYAEIEPSYATDKRVTWEVSSNPDVAEVTANGLVTAKKAGTATITVTSKDGNKTASCIVTVVTIAVDVTGVSLNKSSISLEVGDTETLVATIAPSNATNQNVTWNSNSAVAEVSENGTVTAKKSGTATITVTSKDSNRTASCIVTVISWDVYNETTWNEAVNRIKTGGNNKAYTVTVTDNFNIPGVTANTFGSVTGINITIIGDKEISLAAGSKGSLLRIGANQTVIIRDTDLKGHMDNNASLVYISGANSSFIMQGSATVSGNHSKSSGGGVYVGSSTFTMQGSAAVSGNIVVGANGGGVYVDSGTLTMQGSAAVSGNTANDSSSSSGGGVYINSGTFIMQGNATVLGNTNESSSSSGGGVYILSGSFTMQGNATVSGNTNNPYSLNNSGGGVYISRNAAFTMQNNATVSGNTSRSGGGVNVSGTFIMQDNATVSGNTGCGVDTSGTFTMQDNAIVSGNTSSAMSNSYNFWGGGVSVTGSDGNFTMKSGTISGNSGYPGVVVWGGTFTIQGGTVYGSDVGIPLRNHTSYNDGGDALKVMNGTAKYSNGSDILPHTDGYAKYTNNTIIGK